MKKRIISLISLYTLLLGGKLFMNSTSKVEAKKLDNAEETDLLGEPVLNSELQFAGQLVPVDNPEVKARLDREMKANRYWRPIAAGLAQKASRYFPIIRPILKRNGIPDDFKYVPLIESGFTNMVSYSGAAGPWQIMPSTARHYGLSINSQVDERYHVVMSTEAACKILKEAYASLKDWTLVAASFNKGLEGIRGAMKRQHVNSYYKLHLNTQAQRYVFRLLAVKELMEHPSKYGFRKNSSHFYYSIPTYRVKVSNSISNLVTFARKQGVSLKTLKAYNPWLKSNRFDNPGNKTYYIEIPKNKEILPLEIPENAVAVKQGPFKVMRTDIDSTEHFINNTIVEKNDYRNDDVLVQNYTVNDGEDINFVAQKFRVKPSRIVEWNKLKTAAVHKGDVLKIYLGESFEETGQK